MQFVIPSDTCIYIFSPLRMHLCSRPVSGLSPRKQLWCCLATSTWVGVQLLFGGGGNSCTPFQVDRNLEALPSYHVSDDTIGSFTLPTPLRQKELNWKPHLSIRKQGPLMGCIATRSPYHPTEIKVGTGAPLKDDGQRCRIQYS